MVSYFYYWVPTQVFLNFSDHKILKSSIALPKKIISDIGINFEITANIEVENYNLEITVLDSNDVIETVKMRCVSQHENGIMVYEVIQPLSSETMEILKVQAYHQYKNFFHIHQHHDCNEDSLLIAHVSHVSHDNSLNEAIQHYCELYSKKFGYYKNILSLNSPNSLSSLFTSSKKINSHIKPMTEAITIAKDTIYKAYGEMIYAEFVLNAIDEQKKKDEYHFIFKKFQKEFEIEHSRYEQLYEKIDMEYSRITNKHQVILGLAFGIVGIILSIIQLA